MVGAAGHLTVSVLHLRRYAGVDRAVVFLELGGQLAQPVEFALYLVDDGSSGSVGKAGEQERIALGVVGDIETADSVIDSLSKRRDRIGDWPPQYVEGIRMHGSVTVSECRDLAQR